jgi:hypothetical protein
VLPASLPSPNIAPPPTNVDPPNTAIRIKNSRRPQPFENCSAMILICMDKIKFIIATPPLQTTLFGYFSNTNG